MRELFVYYRVRFDDAPALVEAVRRLHEALREVQPGLRARLLRRPEPHDGHDTWMEAYACDTGITADLEAAIAARAGDLLTMIAGPRHTEAFIACAS